MPKVTNPTKDTGMNKWLKGRDTDYRKLQKETAKDLPKQIKPYEGCSTGKKKLDYDLE